MMLICCVVTESMNLTAWLNYRRMNGILCCTGLKTGKFNIKFVWSLADMNDNTTRSANKF